MRWGLSIHPLITLVMKLKKLCSRSDPPQAFRAISNEHFTVLANFDLKLCEGTVKRKTDAYTAFLCDRGSCTLLINNETYTLGKGDLLFCPPGTRIESTEISTDFHSKGFYLTRPFFTDLISIPFAMWNVNRYLSRRPVLTLPDKAYAVFCQFYDLISERVAAYEPSPTRASLITMLMQALIVEFHEAMQQMIETAPARYTSGDNLYRRFLNLLFSTYPRPRDVSWYADQLSVSPKYLSNVCKENSRLTASKLIQRQVMEDVKRMLVRPDKSIKEIAGELNFNTISFFGKYVKKNLGMSPKTYRATLS